MLKNDKQWFWNAVEVLQQDVTSSAEAIKALIELFHIGVLLQRGDLSDWLSLEEKEERIKFLREHLHDKGTARISAMMIAEGLERLGLKTRHQLMTLILQKELPSQELALELVKLWHSEKTVSMGIPIRMAELAYRLASKGQSSAGKTLCRGSTAETFALVAGMNGPTVYELPEPGSGKSLKRAIIETSGLDVELRELEQLSNLNRDDENYSVGLVSETWGSRSTKKNSATLGAFSSYSNLSSDVIGLDTLLEKVTGRIVCVVSPSWLYKTSGEDAEFKRNLVASGRLDAVIQLPERSLAGISVAPTLLVVNTLDRFDAIQFIDGSEFFDVTPTASYRELADIEKIVDAFDSGDNLEISTYVPIEDVLAQGCNLDAMRYFVDDKQEQAQKLVDSFDQVYELGDLVEVLRCQAIRSATTAKDLANSFDADKYLEVSPSQIDRCGVLVDAEGMRRIAPLNKDISQAERQRVYAGDILFVIKGSLGKCAMVTKEFEGCIGNQSFVILRSKDKKKLPPLVLFRYLMSPLGKLLVSRWAAGTTVPMIKMQDLRKIPIPVLSILDQEKIEANQEAVQQLRRSLMEIELRLEEKLAELWSLG